MSRRKKTPARSPLPWIVFLIVCAGVAVIFSKQHSNAPKTTATEMKRPAMAPATNIGLLLNVTNQALAQDSEARVAALIAEGNELLSKANYAGAAQKFEEAEKLSPEQEDIHYNLAIALARQGKTEEAKKQYEEALRIFPDYAEAHNNLGNLLLTENKIDEAIGRFREAIKNMPDNASFHNNLGTALGRQRKVIEAKAEFEEAIKKNPEYVQARVNLANTLLMMGQVDEAIDQLNEALRLKPDFAPALQTMQRARQKKGP